LEEERPEGIGGERSRAGLGGWRLGFFTVGTRFYT
jgi:hypothetical protein